MQLSTRVLRHVKDKTGPGAIYTQRKRTDKEVVENSEACASFYAYNTKFLNLIKGYDEGLAIMDRQHYPVRMCRVKRTHGAKLQATLTSFNNQENEHVEDDSGENETPVAPQAKKGKGKVVKPNDTSKKDSAHVKLKLLIYSTLIRRVR
nr:nuclear export mediator factor NEMF isoform X1 [Tanacetum cinerariifolium]